MVKDREGMEMWFQTEAHLLFLKDWPILFITYYISSFLKLFHNWILCTGSLTVDPVLKSIVNIKALFSKICKGQLWIHTKVCKSLNF